MTVIRFYGIHCNFTYVRCENVFVWLFLFEVASIDQMGYGVPMYWCVLGLLEIWDLGSGLDLITSV